MYKARKNKAEKKIAVTVLGRQPDSHIWEINETTG